MSVISSANTDPTTSRRGEDIHPHSLFTLGFLTTHIYTPTHKSGRRGWRMQDFCELHIYLFIYLHILASPAYKNGITRILLLRFFSKPSTDLSLLWLEFGDIPTISYICLHLPLHLAVVAGPVPTVYLIVTIYPHTHLSLPRRSFPCKTPSLLFYLCRTVQDCIHCFYTYIYSLIAYIALHPVHESRYLLLSRTFRLIS